MTTMTEVAPVRGDTDIGPVDHYYCCDEEVALCGADLSGVPDGPEHDALCPLCADALDANRPCPVSTCPAKEQS